MAYFVSNIYNAFANARRNANLSLEQKIERENGKQQLQMIKAAAIVITLATAIFFFGLFPGAFSLAWTATTAFLATETYKTADNLLEIYEQAAVENRVKGNTKELIEQMGKDTYLVRPLLQIRKSGIEIGRIQEEQQYIRLQEEQQYIG